MYGLCSLRTNSCCCGISLRIGTIIILALNLIGSISLSIIFRNHKICIRHSTVIWIWKVLFNVVEILALFGVFKKKPAFLVPHLVGAAIFLITLSIYIIGFTILFPFAAKFLAGVAYETPDGKTERISEFEKDFFYVIYAGFIVVAIIYAAIRFHFLKVVISYYVELKTILFCGNPTPTISFVA